MEKFIDSKIEITEKKIDEILAIGTSYDLLKRKITIGDKNAVLYFINGFCDEDVMEKVIEALTSVKSEDIPNDKENFIANIIPYIETSDESNEYNIITAILSGIVCLIVDGYESAFLIDAREYPARGVEEPEKYKVLRGSRDGFVETLVYNTALIRRRIRSPEYRCEITQIGECSRTDVAICYIEGRVDKEALNLIKDKLANAKIDALAMNQESLAECIYKGSWINPFPKFRYTERPDTVAASVINGQIAVLVDNSPAAMLLPTTVFDAIEEADDYYFSPLTGTYLRLARAFITIISILLTPLYLLYAVQPELLPNWLIFTKVSDELNIPIIWQLLMLEIGVDG